MNLYSFSIFQVNLKITNNLIDNNHNLLIYLFLNY